jgi:putative flippase GtrA
MASLLGRARAFRQTDKFRRLWKFGSVSIISTAISQVVFFTTYHVWHVATAMECNVIATAVASIPAYFLNRTWTWGKTGRSDIWREVVPFWAISFLGLVLSTIAVGVAAHNADRIASGSLERALMVNFANLFTYGCIWTGRYIIFNRYLFGQRTQSGVQEPDDNLPSRSERAGAAMAVPIAADASLYESGLGQLAAREGADPIH